jgi:hypothetical protein
VPARGGERDQRWGALLGGQNDAADASIVSGRALLALSSDWPSSHVAGNMRPPICHLAPATRHPPDHKLLKALMRGRRTRGWLMRVLARRPQCALRLSPVTSRLTQLLWIRLHRIRRQGCAQLDTVQHLKSVVEFVWRRAGDDDLPQRIASTLLGRIHLRSKSLHAFETTLMPPLLIVRRTMLARFGVCGIGTYYRERMIAVAAAACCSGRGSRSIQYHGSTVHAITANYYRADDSARLA